jgi:hypothetical protein
MTGVAIYHYNLYRENARTSRSEGPVNKSSYFLGDPPPDPRFLASLGELSLVELPFMERTLLVELHTFGAKGSSLVCLPMNAMHLIGGSYKARQ